MKSIVEFCLGR